MIVAVFLLGVWTVPVWEPVQIRHLLLASWVLLEVDRVRRRCRRRQRALARKPARR